MAIYLSGPYGRKQDRIGIPYYLSLRRKTVR